MFPLFTGLSVMGTAFAFAFMTGRKLQAMIDRMVMLDVRLKQLEDVVNNTRRERGDDMGVLREQVRREWLLQSGMRILIIEDEPADVQILRRKLGEEFLIEDCGSLAEAQGHLLANDFDCVLLDLNLPDAPLRSTVSEFRRRCPDALCIVLTGHIDPRVLAAARSQGADDVLQKGKDDQDIRIFRRRIHQAIWKKRSSI